MTEVENLDGRRIVRNELGQFVKVELDPETARAMSERATEIRRTDGSKQLLQEAGYKPGTEPEHLRLLAQIASSKRTGSVAALRDFRKITQPEQQSKTIANTGKRKVELVGGFDFLIKVDGKLYRKVGPEAAEIARMIKDPDAVEVVASG